MIDSDGPLPPAFFEQMVETVGVGVAIYGADGCYRYVNEAYADLFGVERDQLVGIHVCDIVSTFDRDRFEGYWESFSDGETRTAETEHVFAGKRVPVETVTTRRPIDGTAYHFGTVRDISERKAYRERLERQNERLEAYTGVVSHDLRNPLNAAGMYLDLARQDCETEHLDMVGSALDRMETLIEDLLTLAREGDVVDETQRVWLGDAVRSAWETAGSPEGSLTVEDGGSFDADRHRLQQVFENLFRNAVDHAGEDVSIRVGTLPDGIYVEDDGPGIPEDQREAVFETGVTVNGGSGFGLAIVKRIVEAHGWHVEATESMEGGARFEITGIDLGA